MKNEPEANFVSVLIVDDDPVFSALAEAVLLDSGRARVETPGPGAEGVRRALGADPQPDLVVLDLNMPDLDGLAAMRLLAELNYKGSVAIVSGEKPAVLKPRPALRACTGCVLRASCRSP